MPQVIRHIDEIYGHRKHRPILGKKETVRMLFFVTVPRE